MNFNLLIQVLVNLFVNMKISRMPASLAWTAGRAAHPRLPKQRTPVSGRLSTMQDAKEHLDPFSFSSSLFE